MLVTPIFTGQGLGNQLACIITTKVLALDRGFDFKVVYPERFKGHFFKHLELPEIKGFEFPVEGQPPTLMPLGFTYYREKSVRNAQNDDISPYDESLQQIGDNTCLHGLLQGEDYFKHRLNEIREWLEVEPLEMSDDTCVINFRGGEYVGVQSFFLPQSYWDNAIAEMLKVNPNMRFEVHTDDVHTARQFFPHYYIIHDVEINWRSIRYAKYLILSNSSFAILPTILNEDKKRVIAPKYFCRFNTSDGFWSIDQNYIEGLEYLDRNGIITTTK